MRAGPRPGPTCDKTLVIAPLGRTRQKYPLHSPLRAKPPSRCTAPAGRTVVGRAISVGAIPASAADGAPRAFHAHPCFSNGAKWQYDLPQPIFDFETDDPGKFTFIIRHYGMTQRQGVCGDQQVVAADRLPGSLRS